MARNSIVAKHKKLNKMLDILWVGSDKALYFDKALVAMINNCIGKVAYHEAENVTLT
jgi:hypothetical protein